MSNLQRYLRVYSRHRQERIHTLRLNTQRFWHALRADGTPSEDPRSTRLIELDPALFELLRQPHFRRLARLLLVQTWFPPAEQVGLATSLALELGQPEPLVAEARTAYETIGRDARFRVQVIVQYQYTCALTGTTLTATQSGATLVEAAHIAAFADTRNNDPRNGLALTPDAHWSFDEGSGPSTTTSAWSSPAAPSLSRAPPARPSPPATAAPCTSPRARRSVPTRTPSPGTASTGSFVIESSKLPPTKEDDAPANAGAPESRPGHPDVGETRGRET